LIAVCGEKKKVYGNDTISLRSEPVDLLEVALCAATGTGNAHQRALDFLGAKIIVLPHLLRVHMVDGHLLGFRRAKQLPQEKKKKEKKEKKEKRR